MDVENLIAQGEGQSVEFKKSLSLRREAMEALCGMVNADCAKGTILFGVEPDGTLCGVESGNLDSAQRSLSQALNQRFEPPLRCEIQVKTVGDRQLVVLSAERARSVAYHEYDGRAWIRGGSEKRQLTLAEKEQMRRSRDRATHPGPWRCDRCGSWVGIVIGNTMTKYNCSCGGQLRPCT